MSYLNHRQLLVLSLISVGGVCASFSLACPIEGEPPPIIDKGYYRGAVDGGGVGFEPEQDTQTPGEELLTVLDIAHQLLAGDLSDSLTKGSQSIRYSRESIREGAIEAFETHLADYPEDWYSTREYAYALFDNAHYKDGFKALMRSYAGDETLVRNQLDRSLFGESDARFIKMTQKLVRYAKANDSAQAWFAVAVLLQGRGEYEHAKANLERAKELGLDEALAKRMESALQSSIDALIGLSQE
ncbi:MAG: hypothetical protein ACWA5W_03375 [Phycisphaerales bacterium]